ncbi:MAG: endonuclease [Puniceicoccaceae bacterium]|nr:endonuclease [Puniceicoccaceae bacterium]
MFHHIVSYFKVTLLADRILLITAFLGTVTTYSLNAQSENYYSGVYGLSGSELKQTINNIIDNHTSISYEAVWNAHKDLYRDPNNSDNIILFYSQASISNEDQDAGGDPGTYFNREHLWPRSYGVGTSGDDNSDLHSLVPAYKSVNSTRGNKYFDNSDPNESQYSNPANVLAPNCTSNSDTFEPGDAQKGRVARAILYMDTRYDDLELVDTPPSPAPDSSSNRMAQLSTLLNWNRRFPPTDNEITNNQKIYESYQNNRNPYIDHPEFADKIWIEGPSWGKWRLDNFSLSELNDSSISGDSADPDEDGISNLMERAIYSNPKTVNVSKPVTVEVSGTDLLITFTRARNTENINANIVLEESEDLINWNSVDLSNASTQVLNENQESVQLSLASTSDSIITVVSTTNVTLVDSISELAAEDIAGDNAWDIQSENNYAVIYRDWGDPDEEDWLIFPEINLDNYTEEILSLEYRSRFLDPMDTGLKLYYTNQYTSDPSSTNWVELMDANAELDLNKSMSSSATGTYTLQSDLSNIDGTTIRIGIKYTSTEQYSTYARAWLVANPNVLATQTTTTNIGDNSGAIKKYSYYRVRASSF